MRNAREKDGITDGMKVWLSFMLGIMLALPTSAASPGSFAGTVVSGPESADTWLYVQGRNHSVRRVYVSGAKFVSDEGVPATERKRPVPTTLPAGTKVRIVAEQDDAGEWRATQIEILAAGEDEKKAPASTTSQS